MFQLSMLGEKAECAADTIPPLSNRAGSHTLLAVSAVKNDPSP